MKGKVKIYESRVKGEINKNIYGHFIEHLGRCVYEEFMMREVI